jgi:hypothetical protein
VKWITFAGRITGQDEVHRTARADFNVRGWQGRLRHTALAALFFWGLLPANADFGRPGPKRPVATLGRDLSCNLVMMRNPTLAL